LPPEIKVRQDGVVHFLMSGFQTTPSDPMNAKHVSALLTKRLVNSKAAMHG
jgi:hypothetical protein